MMLWTEILEPWEGSLALLSPPLGIWKLPPLLLALGIGGFVVGSQVESFDDIVGCWEGTAPFGTCGVALGLMCAALAGVDLVMVDLVDCRQCK